MKGIIFDVQHFCVHDGPGIRTVVFFKGCPLRCVWCCNPESQKMAPELMFNEEKCIKCFKCISCQRNAIIYNSAITINRDLCNTCGDCEKMCPTNSLHIVGSLMKVEDVLNEILKDKAFYGEKGGVTFSGGEPLMQIEFLHDLAKLLNSNGIHMAIETSGYAKWQKIQKVLPYIDLFLYDIKAVDNRRHKSFTGVRNELILENLKKVAKEKETVVRCVVVDGYNFTSEKDAIKLAEICRFAQVERIDLLRYHRFGEKKYKMLGRKYDVKVNDTGLINRIKDLLVKEGFKVSIDGLL
ncbi:MAG: glycyl-radical enzyme activating protein [Archaeoglobaceae archaeon]|nr:glycyl-radical enzyme activating protein [Archaeoglobaceae archaeon]